MLSKMMFQLLLHICITYATIFLLLESERFEYFRNFVSGRIGQDRGRQILNLWITYPKFYEN